MEVKMQRVTIALQDWMLRRIDETARELGTSRAVAIRLLLLAGLGELHFAKAQGQKEGEAKIVWRSDREIQYRRQTE